MNFFGHAAVARRISEDAGFVLGAMLPDFVTMAGARIRKVDDAEISAGIDNHHRTDRAFHETPSFRRLCAAGSEALQALGVSHGSCMAVAHVGVEILLDGALTDEPATCTAYLRALEVGAPDDRGAAITWWAPEHEARWDLLRRRLLSLGVPDDLDPARVCERLFIALAGRPRLALSDRDRAPVEQWVRRATRSVRAHREALLRELHSGMDRAP